MSFFGQIFYLLISVLCPRHNVATRSYRGYDFTNTMRHFSLLPLVFTVCMVKDVYMPLCSSSFKSFTTQSRWHDIKFFVLTHVIFYIIVYITGNKENKKASNDLKVEQRVTFFFCTLYVNNKKNIYKYNKYFLRHQQNEKNEFVWNWRGWTVLNT